MQDSWVFLIIVVKNITMYQYYFSTSSCGTFAQCLSLVVLLLVRPSNFIVSGVKSWR